MAEKKTLEQKIAEQEAKLKSMKKELHAEKIRQKKLAERERLRITSEFKMLLGQKLCDGFNETDDSIVGLYNLTKDKDGNAIENHQAFYDEIDTVSQNILNAFAKKNSIAK